MQQCKIVLIALGWALLEQTSSQESFHYSSFIGPVSGDVEEISVPHSIFPSQYKNSYDRDSKHTYDYVAKPDYKFVYGVEDPPTGNSHKHEEERNGDVVRGEYSVLEPDGAIRRVVYTADSRNGFRATVHRTPPPSSARASHSPPEENNRKELSPILESTPNAPLANDVNPTVVTQSSLKPPDFASGTSQEGGEAVNNKYLDPKVEDAPPVTPFSDQSYPLDSTTQSPIDHNVPLSDPILGSNPQNPPSSANYDNQQPYNEPLPVTSPAHTPSPYSDDYNGPTNDLQPYHGPNHIHSDPPPPSPSYSDPYIHNPGPEPIHHNTLPQYAPPISSDYYNPPPPPPPPQSYPIQPFYTGPAQYHPQLNLQHSQIPAPSQPTYYGHFSDRQDAIYGSPLYPSHSPIPLHHHHPSYYGDYAY